MVHGTTVEDWGGLGRELGRGGQARVVELKRDDQFVVAKLYMHATRPSGQVLTEVIDWRPSLSGEERAVIDSQTAWPCELLSDDRGQNIGVVLPAIPPIYYAEIIVRGRRRYRPRELSYLLSPRKSSDLGIARPDLETRMRICRDWISVFEVLDSHGVVFGDISMRNLLWSADFAGRGYVIDCDTAQTDPPRSPAPWTQDWDDPFLDPAAGSQPADLASDRYKLALVVYRAIVGHPSRRPPKTMSQLHDDIKEPVPDELHGLILAGSGRDRVGRPRPSSWRSVMDDWIPPRPESAGHVDVPSAQPSAAAPTVVAPSVVAPSVDASDMYAPELVLPFYLLCDESESLGGESIDAINQQLVDLHAEIVADPVVSDKAYFGIVAFSDDAATILPLSDLHDVREIPLLAAGGEANYTAAFTHMKAQITYDIDRLKSAGTRAYRPAVFFISDGKPSDPDWGRAYADLVDRSYGYRPNIISFGVGGGNPDIIGKIGTLAAYQASSADEVPSVLREFAHSLTKSVVQSTNAAATGRVALVPPETPQGFVELRLTE